MFKNIILAVSLILAGCSGAAKPTPVTPPPTTQAPKEETKAKPVEPAVVLSVTTTVFSGPSWSVAFPDNMKVVDQDVDSVRVVAADKTEMRFIRQAGDKTSLEDLSAGVIMAFTIRGHQPEFVGEAVMDRRPASVIGFSGGRGIVVFVLTATGSNTYALVYMGHEGQDRVDAVKAAMASVKLTDKVMTVKPSKPVKK